MRSNRLTFVSTPSQKSLTYATQDSQGDLSSGYYLPANQKRFTRKNLNGSVQKKKSRTNLLDNEHQTSITISRLQETPKVSKQKATPSYIKVNPQLRDSRLNRTQKEVGNHIRSGSFKVQRNRLLRKSNFEDTIRISEQKANSRYSGKSIDSGASRYGKQNNVSVLRTQLELKQKQLMILQDERRRYRNNMQELKRKQNVLQQQITKIQSQSKLIQENLKQKMNELKTKLTQSTDIIAKYNKQNQQLKKQLILNTKQKKIVQKQLKMFVDKQVPKNVRQLQSCREISLEQTIEQLKIQINRNKTQLQKQMQETIANLRFDNIELKNEIKNYQIMNRLLQKKSADAKRYLQAYTSIKIQYKDTRKQLKQIRQQCDLLRKQNVKMKKQIKQYKKNTNNTLNRKKQKLYTQGCQYSRAQRQYIIDQRSLTRVPSDAESLTLSISQY